MKYEFYKAVDAIDGAFSIFVFDEDRNYTVVPYSDWGLENLFHRAVKNCACDWGAEVGAGRFKDMIDPELIFILEAPQ